MDGLSPVCLVLAKAPVPGFAKTRLCPPATPAQAAAVAAAALLDTLDAVLASGLRPVVALTGALAEATARDDVAKALESCTVIPQRGDDLATRVANAHADAAARHPGAPVVQIGMDTPQLTATTLTTAAELLLGDGRDAVIGPAVDGGWWALGLRDSRRAAVLRDIPMSIPDTGRLTRQALTAAGLRVADLAELRDVDTMADARQVAAEMPHGRFPAAVARVPTAGRASRRRLRAWES